MDNIIKLAAAILILVTILCGLHILPAETELKAIGIVLGSAVALQHGREATASHVARLRQWLQARARRCRRIARLRRTRRGD